LKRDGPDVVLFIKEKDEEGEMDGEEREEKARKKGEKERNREGRINIGCLVLNGWRRERDNSC
jgi:hypothetical protein